MFPRSVFISLKTQIVLLEWRAPPHGCSSLYLTFRGLLGLESGYKSRFKNGWCIQRRISIVLVHKSLRGDHYCFLNQWKLIPLKGNAEAVYYPEVGEATSTGSEQATPTAPGRASLAKKMHQTWKSQGLHFDQGLPTCPQFTGSHPFSIKAIIKNPKRLEIQVSL